MSARGRVEDEDINNQTLQVYAVSGLNNEAAGAMATTGCGIKRPEFLLIQKGMFVMVKRTSS